MKFAAYLALAGYAAARPEEEKFTELPDAGDMPSDSYSGYLQVGASK